VVEGSGFENRRTVRYRGFESHHLLHFRLFNNIAFNKNTLWRRDRVAEGARLLIVCGAKSSTEGSNPSVSTIKYQNLRNELDGLYMRP
jgi:hypothetical protein